MKRDGKLNIAMLGHKRIPSREGGIEIVVEELSIRLVARKHHVTCYNRGGHHICGKEYDTKKEKNYKGIRLKFVLTVNIKGFAAMTASLFGALCTAFGKYDVVHFHAEGPCAMLWLPKMFGKRCIATIHGLDHQRAKWGKFASAYIMLGEKCAVKYADEIIVLSKGIQNYFQNTYGRKTSFIPNGVSRPQVIQAEIITKVYGLEKDQYILFLGRLVPEKGIQYLIKAFRETNTEKKLVIAGGSSDTNDFLDQLEELAMGEDRIIFTGFIQGKILDELYSNAYLYVLPSDLEGMPLSLLEAMSYGNCCLVSDIEECTSVVEEKAMVFKKGDIGDLKEKLKMACENNNLVQSYKERAADYICKKYSWDRTVEKTEELYKGDRKA